MTLQEQAKQLAELLLSHLKASAEKSEKARNPIMYEVGDYYRVKDTKSHKAIWISKLSLECKLERQHCWDVLSANEVHTSLLELGHTEIITRAKTFYQDDYYDIYSKESLGLN
jgi:hypothetical protein